MAVAETEPEAGSLACRVFGHRLRFEAEGEVMRWTCARGCGFTGEKTYATAEDARRYAAAFDREDADNIGHRTPLSMFFLRFGRKRRSG